MLAAIIDLTERKRAENRIKAQAASLEKANKQLEALATVDSLTGLKNRRYFFDRLGAHLNLAQRVKHSLSLLMMDIDRFKTFNDTFGHQAGDEVLKTTSELLQDTARAGDCVARYGGEEFVISLPETDRQGSLLLQGARPQPCDPFRRNPVNHPHCC